MRGVTVVFVMATVEHHPPNFINNTQNANAIVDKSQEQIAAKFTRRIGGNSRFLACSESKPIAQNLVEVKTVHIWCFCIGFIVDQVVVAVIRAGVSSTEIDLQNTMTYKSEKLQV